jgi:hypothetical protein
MTFKSATWYPIALVLCGVNAVAAWMAVTQAEQLHGAVHLALALGFGLWAQRLRPLRARPETLEGVQGQVEALDGEVSQLRRELTETQERLDFVERMLAQEREKPRVAPPR